MVCLVVYGVESSTGLLQLFFEVFSRNVREACPEPEAPRQILTADFERELNESLSALFRT